MPSRKVTKEFALAHPHRTSILAIVGAEPGVTMSVLAQRLACQPSTIIWHATKLERAGMLRSERVGTLRVFYLPGGGVELRNRTLATALLHNDLARRIHEVVLREPGITFRGLSTRLMANVSILRWHARRLVAQGLLCEAGLGRATEFYPTARLGAPCEQSVPA